jgi:predicted Ser/Thr protein kinase
MIGLGWSEIVILLLCCSVFVIGPLVVTLVVLLTQSGRGRSGQTGVTLPGGREPQPNAPQTPQPFDDSDRRQTIIARLTQRFCPQCRAALAPDAPEGLCPACLLAGGLDSAAIEPASGMAATTPPSGSRPPASGEWTDLAARFPDLEILELLGRGGMGSVYKARQKNLDRLVALKVIPPDAASDPAFAERFAREGRAMAKMNHPNIVTVHNFGNDDNFYWLLMEYVDGVNLRHTLRAGRLAPQEALAIVPQICDALQYAHDQGVVHRDIKPENVLLDRSGRIKIADFGLAKLLGKGVDDFTLTRTQQVMGTPRYMAPEQIERPSAVDHRADIYSLGVVLYEMLTGELPLGRFEPPSHKVAIDVRIDQVVLRALEKAPERRYQRASEVKTELASAASWPSLAAPAASGQQGNPPAAGLEPPVWHTPNPATKFGAFYDSRNSESSPLGPVLLVAFGMVLGVLLMSAGLAAGVYALLNFPGFSGEWWGWMGGAFGCIVGGFGSAAGSYNTYRQMSGAVDLLRSPSVTWFDWVMRGYFLLGIVLLVIALAMFDSAPWDAFLPTLLLGGIATFQAVLFLLWRAFTRPVGPDSPGPANNVRTEPADPSYPRAVVWPTLAMVGLFAVILADVHFAIPPAGSQGVTSKMRSYREWHEAIILTSFLVLPLCLLGLGIWRTWGPRRRDAEGRWYVPSPFTGRGWLWAVAVLAGLSLFLPWFRLSVDPAAEVVLHTGDVMPHRPGHEAVVAFTLSAEQLRSIATMPSEWRYVFRGMQNGASAAAACLVIFAALLSAIVFDPHRTGRIMFLLVMGGVALLLVTVLLHDAAEQSERIVVDDVTESGLYAYAARTYGGSPQSIEPWRRALRTAFVAKPAIGVFALLAACGLAIFIGVTEASWGLKPSVAAEKQSMASRATESAPVDPARAAVLARVAGPGIGLIVVGALGFLPLVLAVLLVPAWTFVPQAGEIQQHREALESLDGRVLPTVAAAGIALHHPPSAALAAAGLFLPPTLAQMAPPPQPTNALVLWFPIALILYLLNFAFSATLIIGGWRMRQAKSYGLSIVASVVALLPCTLGWIVGLPIGIWALFVLLDPQVKAGFDS